MKRPPGSTAPPLPARTPLAPMFALLENDADKLYANDIVFIGEFIRENYPGVVIYDPYNEDLW